jgi:surfeit locus 1 family protein
MGVPEKGWIQVTPVLSPNGSRVILVRRGWVPDSWRTDGLWRSDKNPGHGSGVGVVSAGEIGNSFVPANDPKSGQWFSLKPAEMV